MTWGRLEKSVVPDSSHVSTNLPCHIQRFCREVVTWKALRHPNVLPLLGVTMTETRFVMMSEWMTKGNINEFLKTDSTADRLGLVCFSFKFPISSLTVR